LRIADSLTNGANPHSAIRIPQFTHDPRARRSTQRRIYAVPGFGLAHEPIRARFPFARSADAR